MSTEEELPPSKLGTKEYWDKVYEREVGVFEDTGDEGEVWFGERAMVKMRDWVYANCQPEQEEQSGENSEKRRIRVMECGCGNATLLLSLLTPPANDDDSDEENEDGNSAARPRFMPTQLTGIDYSEASIKLAQGVAERRRDMWRRRVEKARKAAAGADEETKESSQSSEDEDEDYDSDDETLSPATLQLDDPLLTSLPLFLTGDLLNFRSIRDLYSTLPESSPVKQSSEIDEPWDLVLDKGTFDALALSQETIPVPRRNQDGTEELEQRLPSAVYPEKVSELVKKGGFFLITSCNFTEQEIKNRFGRPELGTHRSWSPRNNTYTAIAVILLNYWPRLTGFEFHSRVAHPSFSFGGQTGSSVCTVAFRKV